MGAWSGLSGPDSTSQRPSRDRVKFFMPEIFGPGHTRYDGIVECCRRAFEMTEGEVARLFRAGGDEGFWVVCRPSQFARFLIFRNDAGLGNDFKRLSPQLIGIVRRDCCIDVHDRRYEPGD